MSRRSERAARWTAPTRGRTTTALTAGFALLVAGCSDPAPPEAAPVEDEGADEVEDVLAEEAPDPAQADLEQALEQLITTLTAARDELAEVAAEPTPARARSGATAALRLLLDDPATSSSTPAVFPARTLERSDSGGQDDLLSGTLTAAREAGGTSGEAAIQALRDPVAGDLGAWERDAEGVVAGAADVVAGVRDVEAVTPAVLELPADGIRALAWTLLATETDDVDVTRAAAERASGHLTVALLGLEPMEPSP